MKVLYYVEKELAQFDPARRLRGRCEHRRVSRVWAPARRGLVAEGAAGLGALNAAALDAQGQNWRGAGEAPWREWLAPRVQEGGTKGPWREGQGHGVPRGSCRVSVSPGQLGPPGGGSVSLKRSSGRG